MSAGTYIQERRVALPWDRRHLVARSPISRGSPLALYCSSAPGRPTFLMALPRSPRRVKPSISDHIQGDSQNANLYANKPGYLGRSKACQSAIIMQTFGQPTHGSGLMTEQNVRPPADPYILDDPSPWQIEPNVGGIRVLEQPIRDLLHRPSFVS
jgi:hypothetical protein